MLLSYEKQSNGLNFTQLPFLLCGRSIDIYIYLRSAVVMSGHLYSSSIPHILACFPLAEK